MRSSACLGLLVLLAVGFSPFAPTGDSNEALLQRLSCYWFSKHVLEFGCCPLRAGNPQRKCCVGLLQQFAVLCRIPRIDCGRKPLELCRGGRSEERRVGKEGRSR